MIEAVLATLDGSALSEAVLESVRRLAEGAGIRVTLLRVIDPVGHAGEPYATPLIMASPPDLIITPSMRRASGDELHDLIKEAEDYLSSHAEVLRRAGIQVEVKAVVDDNVPRAIVAEANNGYDLVAMATHGRSGLARLALGSVAMAVVKRLPIPLLLVPPAAASS